MRKLVRELSFSNSSCSQTKLGSYGEQPRTRGIICTPQNNPPVMHWLTCCFGQVGYKPLITNIHINQKGLRGSRSSAGVQLLAWVVKERSVDTLVLLVTVFSTLPVTSIMITSCWAVNSCEKGHITVPYPISPLAAHSTCSMNGPVDPKCLTDARPPSKAHL